MSQYSPGLAGVTAFTTTISEPDREGGTLRYRGVEVDRLAQALNFEDVWSLLVAKDFNYTWTPVDHIPLSESTHDIRIDLQANTAALAARLSLKPSVDCSDSEVLHDLAVVSQHMLSFVAQSARGSKAPVDRRAWEAATSAAERFMIEWQDDPDPDHVAAVNDYWITAAEHGANASTFTARVIASTGADVAAALSGAVGSLSGPLHGGAPSRALDLVNEVMDSGNAEEKVAKILDSNQRLMGFGHPVYRAEDPRARVMRETAKRLKMPKYDAAVAVENAALDLLRERKPDRVLATNVDFWAAVVLDFAEIPHELMTPLFACARTAGWSAHILEQHGAGKIFRPSAEYIGSKDVKPESVPGWAALVQK